MSKIRGIILDMDGTLYPFENSLKFAETPFGQRIRQNGYRFMQNAFLLNAAEAVLHYNELDDEFSGEMSIGLEKRYGIPRGDFFAATWSLDVAEFVAPQTGLLNLLQSIDQPLALLSAAPNVWVRRVLRHLNVENIFEPAIFSGESDIRKPSTDAFLQVADFLELAPENLVSIGDQEHTDIIPAKQLGMMTVLVSKDVVSQADFVVPDLVSAINKLKDEDII